MAVYRGNKEIKDLFYGGRRIKKVYLGDVLLYQYDSVAPVLTITAPAGTSSGAPTYTTGATYRVQGTVSDVDSGVAAVYVNGQAATISGTSWYRDITLAANTTTTISVYAVDNAGNQTATVVRYVRYDSAAPSLSVTAPTGTSSGAPTYVQSDGAASYTVSGTVSDASGLRSVTVNGQAATISGNSWSRSLTGLATNTTHTITVVATDNAGRTTTVTRYLRVEAYYQQAARTAGAAVQSSLDATLKNSSVCSSIAGNSTAYGIMAAHYKSQMTSYIDSNWSEGLNFLCYRCKTKCFLLRSTTSYCTNITGGYSKTNSGRMWAASSWQDRDATAFAVNQLNLNGYTTLTATVRIVGNRTSGNADGKVRFGVYSSKSDNETFTKYWEYLLNKSITTTDTTSSASLTITELGNCYLKLYALNRYQVGGDDYGLDVYVYNIILTP